MKNCEKLKIHMMDKKHYQWLDSQHLHQLFQTLFKHKIERQHHHRQAQLFHNNCSLTACPEPATNMAYDVNVDATVGANHSDHTYDPGNLDSNDDYWSDLDFNLSYSSYYDYGETGWLDEQLEELYKILRQSQCNTNIALTAFLAVIFLVGLAGNILVLAVFSRSKIKQASTILIMALASNDLTICGIVLPGVLLKEWYVPFRWDIMCRGWEWLRCATIPLSALILVVVAVDRYVLICCVGERRAISVRQAKYLILAATVVSVCHAIPPMLRVGVYQEDSESESGTVYLGLCLGNDLLVDQPTIDRYWQAMTSEFLLVLIIVIVMYSLVFRTVYKQSKRWAVVSDCSKLVNCNNESRISKSTTGDTGREDTKPNESPQSEKSVVTGSCNTGKRQERINERLDARRGHRQNQTSRSLKFALFSRMMSQKQSHKKMENLQVQCEGRENEGRDSDARMQDSVTSLDDGHYSVLNTSSQDKVSVSSNNVTSQMSCSASCVPTNRRSNMKTDAKKKLANDANLSIKCSEKTIWLKRQNFKMLRISTVEQELHKTSKMKLKKRYRAKIKMMNNEKTSEREFYNTDSLCNQFSMDDTSQSDCLKNDNTIETNVNDTPTTADLEQNVAVHMGNLSKTPAQATTLHTNTEPAGTLPNTPAIHQKDDFTPNLNECDSLVKLSDDSTLCRNTSDKPDMTHVNESKSPDLWRGTKHEVDNLQKASVDREKTGCSSQQQESDETDKSLGISNNQQHESEAAVVNMAQGNPSLSSDRTPVEETDLQNVPSTKEQNQLARNHSQSNKIHSRSQADIQKIQKALSEKDKSDAIWNSTQLPTDVRRSAAANNSSELEMVISHSCKQYKSTSKPTTAPKNTNNHIRLPSSVTKVFERKIHPIKIPDQSVQEPQRGQTPSEHPKSTYQPRQLHQPCTQKRYSTAQVKTAKVLFLVTAIYIFSFAPVLLMILGVIPSHPIPFYGYFIHSAANPLIYSFINQAFRRQLLKLITGKPM